MTGGGPAGPCPGGSILEAVATGSCRDPEVLSHVETCERCRAEITDIRENQRFLADLGAPGDHTADWEAGATAASILVPGYTIVGEIGRGGQGVVYKAVQTAPRRRVALKIPTGEALLTPKGRRRFEQEISVVAGLRHPYIVTVYDRGETGDGRVFVAMEYVSGDRLNEWAARLDRSAGESEQRRGVTVRAKLEIVAKVCEAVQYAHQRGIMHRDVKPGNILVDAEDRPRLLDFGIARLFVPGAIRQTITGEFIGTPAYASPEQVSGEGENVDTRTDVYSLGVVLYELLLARLPYPENANPQRMIEHIRGTEPERVWARTGYRGPVDNELGTILLKALAKDRERRYQTAAALGADLRRYLAGEAIEAKRDSTWYVLRKAARRHRTLAVAAGVALAAVGAGIATATYGLARAGLARERESAERDRARSEAEKLEAIGQILREVMPPTEVRLDDSAGRERRALDLLDEKLAAGLMQEQPLLESAVRTMLASVLRDHGVLNVAEPHARIALRLREQATGPDTAEAAQARNFLAEILLDRQKLDEAQTNAQFALALRRRLWGNEHRDVAQSLDTLARIRLARGDVGPAGRDAAAALAMRRRLFGGENHADVAASLDTLAVISLRAGIPGAARAPARESLIMRFRLFSDEHPDVVRGLDRLREIAAAEGDTARAETLARMVGQLRGSVALAGRSELRQALVDLKLELLGPDDPEVAQSLVLLGAGQMADRHFSEAEASLRRAVDINEKAFGPDHLIIAELMEPLGKCLWVLNREPEAVECRRRRARIYQRELDGKDDMGICVVWREYAWGLACLGRDDEAIKESLDLVAFADQRLGHKDFEASRARAYLAEVYAAGARWNEAEPLASDAMTIARGYAQAPAIEVQLRAMVLGTTLAGLGRWGDAMPLLRESLPLLNESRTIHRFDPHRRVMQQTVRLLEAHGDEVEAAAFRAGRDRPPVGWQ